MRPDAAEISSHPPLQALVLGGYGISELIARQLEAEGLRAVLQTSTGTRLPRPGEGGAMESLRAILRNFADIAGPAPAGRAHLVHPGVSPWAERTELLQLAQDVGLDVVGPSSRVISLAGNRLTLLAEAERLGIPHLVLNFDPIHSIREIEQLRVGKDRERPLVLKSVRGGGSVGLFVVHKDTELTARLPLWLEQLRMNVGEAILFSERYLEGARHLTLPFARLKNGPLELFPVVDASLQHRFRKIVELCPAPGLDPVVERRMREWTARLADAVGFVGVGSVEFLVDSSRAYLLGMLPRIGSGFRLWESVAGTSAVSWQLTALGLRKSPPALEPKREQAAGILLRVLAEDPMLNLPRPGTVREVSTQRDWKLPGASAELHLSVKAGAKLTPSDDPLLGVLTVTAADRIKALNVARGILDELWIAGSIETNERFISSLLHHPWVKEAVFHASFIDEDFVPELRPDPALVPLFAALAAEASAHEGAADNRWAVGDTRAAGDRATLQWAGGAPERFDQGVSGRLVLDDGRSVRACAYPLREGRWLVRVGLWSRLVRRLPEKPAATGARQLLSLVSGKIHSILFLAGTTVGAKQPMVIVESMGTLVPHAVPLEAKISAWKTAPDQEVVAGQELATLEVSRATLPSES